MIHNRKKRSQRGSALVEVALTMVIQLTMILGIVSFGLAVFTYNSVCNAAREGTRYAIVHGSVSSSPATATTITQIVEQETPWLTASNLTVTTTWLKDNKGNPINTPGNPVTVHVQYVFSFITSLIPIPAVTLNSTSKMVILQ